MIRSECVGEVAVVTIDNPPVNATSQAVRQGLLDAITAALRDPRTEAIVVIGAGGRFSAGGDVRELGNTALNQPSLLDTIALIENSRVPVIAAMTGVALGGGLELALACHYRIGAAPLKLGLPEVTLGVIPGAGGTQRLPRLVGAAAALEIITSGRHLDADEALGIGILDAIAGAEDLRQQAVDFARRVGGTLGDSPLHRRAVPKVDLGIFDRFRSAHAEQWRDALAPWKIVQAIEYACTKPAEEGRRYERAAYVECQASPQRAALAHLFIARRQARKNALDERKSQIATTLRVVLVAAIERHRAAGFTAGQISHSLRVAGWTAVGADTTATDEPQIHIGETITASLVSAARKLIDTDHIADAAEIDLISVDGLGFSIYRGGIIFDSNKK